MKNKMSAQLKPYGITPEQRAILLLICKYGAMTQKAICDLLNMEPANMTVTLKRLIASGYIEKIDHPSDSRAYLISVTKKAQNIENELVKMGEDMVELITKGICEKEQEATLKTLTKIFENLKGE